MNYYNEWDPFAANWLANNPMLSPGVVDARSIKEVRGDEIDSYRQCHFFAGIGGWSYALELAGWPTDIPVWTGSCPCQPFSTAGKGKGEADERHLWPEMLRLVAECRPPVVFGEQVSGAAGRAWLAGVRRDLEAVGYAVGAADLCAAGVGAPHVRQRLYWVADRSHEGLEERVGHARVPGSAGRSGKGTLASESRNILDLADGRRLAPRPKQVSGDRRSPLRHEETVHPSGRGENFWSAHQVLSCTDGRSRRAEPGVLPLAHGVSGRVGLIRGYGNAIIPQCAAEFVGAFLDAKGW